MIQTGTEIKLVEESVLRFSTAEPAKDVQLTQGFSLGNDSKQAQSGFSQSPLRYIQDFPGNAYTLPQKSASGDEAADYLCKPLRNQLACH